jgi:hypothetical protein
VHIVDLTEPGIQHDLRLNRSFNLNVIPPLQYQRNFQLKMKAAVTNRLTEGEHPTIMLDSHNHNRIISSKRAKKN